MHPHVERHRRGDHRRHVLQAKAGRGGRRVGAHHQDQCHETVQAAAGWVVRGQGHQPRPVRSGAEAHVSWPVLQADVGRDRPPQGCVRQRATCRPQRS